MDDLITLATLNGFLGINTDIQGTLLPPEDESVFLRDANNVIIKNGAIVKLRGTDYLNSISTQLGESGKRNVLGIPIYRKYDGTMQLLAILPTKLYQLEGDDTWTEEDSITGGLDDSVLSFANAGDKFYFVLTDSTIVYEWDGDDLSVATLTAEGVGAGELKAKHLLEYKTFLILLNIITDEGESPFPQQFWASNAGVITTFSSGDRLDLEVEGVINGGKKLEDSIIVYFDQGVYQVTWQEGFGWTHKSIVDGLGLYCPKTLTGTKDVHFYISQEGLVQYIKGDIPRSISDTKFDKIILEGIDPTYYYRATARYFPHLKHLFLSYPASGSTYNDTQIIYDVSTRELVSKKAIVGENYAIYSSFEKDLSGLTPDARKAYGFSFVPLIGTKEGYIKEQKITEYQDGTSNYVSSTVHPPTFLKDKVRNKRVQEIILLIEKYTDEDITFVIDIANEANESFDYSYTLTGDGNTGIRRYVIKSDDNNSRVNVRGKDFMVRLKDSANPYGWELHTILLQGKYTTEKS